MITYNHEPYIAQAIESVLMQKVNVPFELVIGDDRSTDKTREICKGYYSHYPNIIKLRLPEKNLGAMSNYIENIETCKGRYIAVLEGDDFWTDPNKLQKQFDFLESNNDYSMVHSGKVTLSNGNFLSDKPRLITSGVIIENLLDDNLISTLTVMVRSEIFKSTISRVGIYAKKNKWEMLDYPVWLDIAMTNKIGYLNEISGVYRILPESFSHTSDLKKEYLFGESYIDIKEFYFKEYLKKNRGIEKSFVYKFKENNFHARKNLFFSYGFIAIKSAKVFITTNPFFYFFMVYKKIQRLFSNQFN